jgi:hypothetical protein
VYSMQVGLTVACLLVFPLYATVCVLVFFVRVTVFLLIFIFRFEVTQEIILFVLDPKSYGIQFCMLFRLAFIDNVNQTRCHQF